MPFRVRLYEMINGKLQKNSHKNGNGISRIIQLQRSKLPINFSNTIIGDI